MKRISAMKEEKKQMRKKTGGFTLVELIVVLVILSVLSAVAVPSVLGYIDDGKAKECESRMKTLAADIATAKMSYEVNGMNDKEEFGITEVDAYIADAGGDGKCGDKLYEAVVEDGIIRLTCSNHNRTCDIPTSGRFSVAVNENEDVREAPDPTAMPVPEPTPTPEATPVPESTPTPETHTYTFQIVPDSASSLENMEKGSSAGLTVQVYEDGKLIEDSGRITVEWHFPGCVSGTSNGMSATVEAAQAGGSGQITCDVTVTDKDDNTKKSSATGSSVDVSVKEQPKPRLNGVPDNLKMDKGESRKDLGDASVTDESEAPYPGSVSFRYEGGVPGQLEVDLTTGEVHAFEPGTYYVTVTATDESGNTITDENGNPLQKTVTVTVPTLYIELKLNPTSLSVQEQKTGTITAIAVVKERESGQIRTDKMVTLDGWGSDDTEIATVVGQNGSATVTGVKVGKTNVTVTAKADDLNPVSASATVDVLTASSTASSGILRDSAQLWAEDHGGTSTFNIKKEEFASWFTEQPQGNYGLWEYVGTDGSIKIEQGNSPDVHGQIEWEGGKQYVLRYTPPGGEAEEIVITVGHTIKEIGGFATNSTYKVGENIRINPVIQPPNTTDRIQWEINWWEGDKQPVELTVIDDTHVSLRAVAPGKFTVRAYAITARYGTLVEKISNQITIEPGDGNGQEQNSGIIGVTLNPSSMTLKEGQSGQLEATLQVNDDVDTSKVRYKFYNYNGYVLSTTSSGDTMATVTGLNAGQNTVYVEVYYGDDQQCKATAQCSVTVTSLPDDETQIDGSFFKARDWKWLQQQVQNNKNPTYHVNNNREEENEDETILFYEEYWDNGIKKRDLYIAQGNSEDISKSDSLKNSGTFKEYLNTSEGKDKFFKVDLEHMIEVKYEDLAKDNTKYPCGTIVRVERSPGVYEYYVAYYKASNETKLGSIVEAEGMSTGEEKRDTCGWWKLNALS